MELREKTANKIKEIFISKPESTQQRKEEYINNLKNIIGICKKYKLPEVIIKLENLV